MSPLRTRDGRNFPIRSSESGTVVIPVDRLTNDEATDRIQWPADPLGLKDALRARNARVRQTGEGVICNNRGLRQNWKFFEPDNFCLEVLRFLRPNDAPESPSWGDIEREIDASHAFLGTRPEFRGFPTPQELISCLLEVKRKIRICELTDEAVAGGAVSLTHEALREEGQKLREMANDIRDYQGVSPELRETCRLLLSDTREHGIAEWRLALWLSHADRSDEPRFRMLKPWLRLAWEHIEAISKRGAYATQAEGYAAVAAQLVKIARRLERGGKSSRDPDVARDLREQVSPSVAGDLDHRKALPEGESAEFVHLYDSELICKRMEEAGMIGKDKRRKGKQLAGDCRLTYDTRFRGAMSYLRRHKIVDNVGGYFLTESGLERLKRKKS